MILPMRSLCLGLAITNAQITKEGTMAKKKEAARIEESQIEKEELLDEK